MADLIDRAALGIGKANPNVFEKPEYADGWNSAVKIVQEAPIVDAVPVVRCRDCKYYNGKWLCKISGVPSRKPCDFCSYGIQKDGDGND